MDDRELTELFVARDEKAIGITREKYGAYCLTVANRILSSREDAEECVNDALLRVWESVPPTKPEKMSSYIGRITRNLAVDRLREKKAAGRCPKDGMAVMDELEEVAAEDSLEAIDEGILLRDVLNRFLSEIGEEKARVFVKRYYFFMPISQIARETGNSEGKVTVMLSRLRKNLKSILLKEGIVL